MISMPCLNFHWREIPMLFNGVSSHCDLKCAIIASKENGKIHRAFNTDRNTVYQYKIDGEVISKNDPQKRCDYLVENEDKKTAYIIELKGTDLSHAIEQIEATIQLFSRLFNQNNYTIYPRIVFGSNTHAVNDTRYRKFLKKYPQAKIRSTLIEEPI